MFQKEAHVTILPKNISQFYNTTHKHYATINLYITENAKQENHVLIIYR